MKQHATTLRGTQESEIALNSSIRRLKMQKLVRLSALLVFVFALGTYVTPSASAQEKSAGSKTTVTGCLQKGDEAGEYSITGEDGKTYGLRSKSLKLSQHVGHKVTITGTLRPESAEKKEGEAAEHQTKESEEAGDIRVTDLKMVSEKCQ
jgi:hypothetical protein